MMDKKKIKMDKGINTNMLHGYPVIDPYTGAASIPKYQTSTFDQKELYLDSKKYCYTRFANPTVDVLQQAFANLENAEYGFAFSSGMAAITSTLMMLKTGDHIIFPIEVYGGTFQLATEILVNYNIEVSFLDYDDILAVENAIKPETKIIYIETPSNPLMKITDIRAYVELAKKYNLLTVIDNTFMTPLFQRPIELGCDIVIESVTKFINGHSDVVAGLVATNSEKIAEKIALYQKNFGSIIGVDDAWLTLRGMKTMGVRVEQSARNALIIAEYLSKHPRIKKVHYPGLREHKGYEVNRGQSVSGGAVLSFEFYTKKEMDNFIKRIEIPIFAVSLGGVESILSHPATMSHACMCEKERIKQGVINELVRLSCGIEDIADLLKDLENALK